MKPNRPGRDERGIIVFAILSLLVFLSMAALVIDAGILMAGRTELSRAVDAAALAGAQTLPDQNAASTAAKKYVAPNVTAALYPSPSPTVTFPSSNVIRVSLASDTNAFFARILGLQTFNIGAVAEATRFDPDVAIIIDRSGSMCQDSHPTAGANCPATGPWQPFSTVLQTARSFVDQLPGNVTFTLISYSTTARLDLAPTTNRSTVKSKIDTLKPSGYTDIASSVNQAITQLLAISGSHPKLVVLLTDGRPNTVNGNYVGDNDPRPRQSLISAADLASKKGIMIYGINYGLDVDNALMKTVAESTEGKFYSAPNSTKLQTVYSDIAAQAHIRLTYVN